MQFDIDESRRLTLREDNGRRGMCNDGRVLFIKKVLHKLSSEDLRA